MSDNVFAYQKVAIEMATREVIDTVVVESVKSVKNFG